MAFQEQLSTPSPEAFYMAAKKVFGSVITEPEARARWNYLAHYGRAAFRKYYSEKWAKVLDVFT